VRAILALLLTAGCPAEHAMMDASVEKDAASSDADAMDADPKDADPTDAEPTDADLMDAAVLDAAPDAEPLDAADTGPDVGPTSVLVFSRTEGFRHDSIADGIAAIEALGATNGFTVSATEDDAAFTDVELAGHQAVIFLSTTDDVLDTQEEEAFQRYVQSGGGFVGIHSATDTEYGWAWYGDLVGAYFSNHPAQQNATLVVEDAAHPSTAHLSASWSRFDE
jgi:cytochrome c